ncbi:hypothetical protein CDAR_371661 [Caerostris darwini]|uniref:Uncharacterized protein n=1 Tax=Caerostris darwini TaxID=1538125 RepID=A0AAV4XA26_9ARAC|nr:hypothetical protein CDAR_371661 [Caerostris darwini]
MVDVNISGERGTQQPLRHDVSSFVISGLQTAKRTKKNSLPLATKHKYHTFATDANVFIIEFSTPCTPYPTLAATFVGRKDGQDFALPLATRCCQSPFRLSISSSGKCEEGGSDAGRERMKECPLCSKTRAARPGQPVQYVIRSAPL